MLSPRPLCYKSLAFLLFDDEGARPPFVRLLSFASLWAWQSKLTIEVQTDAGLVVLVRPSDRPSGAILNPSYASYRLDDWRSSVLQALMSVAIERAGSSGFSHRPRLLLTDFQRACVLIGARCGVDPAFCEDEYGRLSSRSDRFSLAQFVELVNSAAHPRVLAG